MLLGVWEVARRLGVCPNTVKSYSDTGQLPCCRDSARRRLFFSSDVEAFAERRKASEQAGVRKLLIQPRKPAGRT
jgi:predicted site-specific integrase-resolvase